MSTFTEALTRFETAFVHLSTVLASYPVALHEQGGVSGWWSSKQVMAHLSGWLVIMDKRFNDFDSGNHANIHFEVDSTNSESVENRLHLIWDETFAELRHRTNDLITRARLLTPDQIAATDRYAEWLDGMGEDFENHTRELQAFLQPPLLEFDDTPEAFLEPSRLFKPVEGMPEHVVLCFFQQVIADLCKDAPVIFTLGSEVGPNPVYMFEIRGRCVAVIHPGVGSAFSAGFLEELIASGGRKFMACGGAGVLRNDIAMGHVVVPTSAVRDEGTSYHYLPPAREVPMHPAAVKAIETTLAEHNIPYVKGKTWTTDGLYRETPAKIVRRREEGCITVEMEAASFFSVAQFRGVTFGQMLYGGDDLSGEVWDSRDWNHDASTREKLFRLAVEAVFNL